MRRRTVLATFVVAISALASAAPAQVAFDPNDPDVQEMMSIRQTMMQRMQDAGVDFQTLGQQFQDGTFDPDAFQQMLVDKEVIDSELMGRMQKAGTKLALTFIKQALNSTDEEWTILLPKLQKIVDANMRLGPVEGKGILGGGGGGGRGMGAMMTAGPDSPVVKALTALRAEIADKDSNNIRIGVKLNEYREARDKVRKELDELQESLRGVLTIRQEGILVGMGILQ